MEAISLSTRTMMNIDLIAILCSVVFCGNSMASDTFGKPRLIVLADMGNEPDEMQQILHLLICSNEVELEGLSCWKMA